MLIRIALFFLKKVNKDKIKYKNSWRHHISEIELFLDDAIEYDIVKVAIKEIRDYEKKQLNCNDVRKR